MITSYFNEITGLFSSGLDLLKLNNWKSSFKKMLNAIEDEFDESLSVKYSKSKESLNLEFSTEAVTQLFTIYELIHKPSSLNPYIKPWESDKRKEFIAFLKHLIGNIVAKSTELRTNLTPGGYEVLTNYVRGGIKCSSIESGDSHRIIYRLDSSAKCVRIYTVIFHYEDPPRTEFDQLLYDAVKENRLNIEDKIELLNKLHLNN